MVKKGLFSGLIFILFCVVYSKVEASSYEYIGSTTCKVCHPTKYNSWQTTLHSKMLQLQATTGTVIGNFTYNPTLSDSSKNIPAVTIGLNYDSVTEKYEVTLGTTTYIVEYVLGSKWKQKYLFKIGDYYYKTPFMWSVALSTWLPKDLDEWYKTDGQVKTTLPGSWGKRCAGCHTTGYTPLSVSSGTFKEAGIGCEACHGPGKIHQSTSTCGGCHGGKEGKKSEKMGDPKIVNPRKLSAQRQAEVCGQCHSRGPSKPNGSFGYPWKDDQSFTAERPGAFLPGGILDDYYQEVSVADTSRFWQDSPVFTEKGHHQEFIGWKGSKHKDYQILCTGCHNPHGSTYGRMTKLNARDNELCYSCHQDKKKGIHSQHKFTVSAGYESGTICIECHLVKTAKSAISYDIRSHQFKFINPEKKATYGMPDSCTSCHNRVTAPLKSTNTAITELATMLTSRVFPADPLNVVVYPNPFKIKEAKDGVLVFAKIPDGSKVKIYTLSGKLVAEIIAGTENCAFWDGKNEDKEECARGIYIFIVESPDSKKQTGKFTLIK